MHPGLKLRHRFNYSLERSGLTKLVFDGNAVKLVQDGREFLFSVNNVEEVEYVLKSNVSKTEYNRLACPAYVVTGYSTDHDHTMLRGVIRPRIIGIHSKPRIVKSLPPEFHFYLEGFDHSEVGRNIGSQNGRLVCGIVPHEKMIDREKIGQDFSVVLPREYRQIYFQRHAAPLAPLHQTSEHC